MPNQEEDPFNPAKPGPGFVMVSIVGLTNLANYWSIPIIESTLHLRPAKRGDGSSARETWQAHIENGMNFCLCHVFPSMDPSPRVAGLGRRMLSIFRIDQEFFKLVNSTVESTSPGPSFAELHRATSWFDICGSACRASETFYAGSYRHTENTNCFILESRDLDCTSSDVVISYVTHSREKVNPTIINSDVRVLTYIMDADADGFRPILRINVVERSFEGPLNSSASPPRRPTVDDDLIDDNLNDYKNNVDDTINMEDYSMHMEEFSSDS
ncbi:hypothetical protein FXO38_21392 [Capsicum annuum]|nr:hypothetical protein FXO38_21392 [Capsicum annuum]